MKLADLLDVRLLDASLAAIEASAVTADSRKVKPGTVFFAMPGTKADGLSFAPAAAAAGAVAIVADRMPVDYPGAPVILADAAAGGTRAALAHAAARLYPAQPATTVAITGTSGKTSVSVFTRQLWARAGLAAGSLGTIGTVTHRGATYGSLTTPDPVELHRTLAHLTAEGVTHLAMEASSHGLDQHRLDGVRLAATAFLNLSRDHLDYHPGMQAYFAAKMALFTRLATEGSTAVIAAGAPWRTRAIAIAREAGLKPLTIGRRESDIVIGRATRAAHGQDLVLRIHGTRHDVHLPLIGAFQASNALVALALCEATGTPLPALISGLETLEGVPGRLEKVGDVDGAPVLIDYAHKPAALATLLDMLKPYAPGRLVCVFGCGGDRDAGKRPMMGRISAEKADVTIVTDDNPRTENPAAIRRAIMAAAPGALEIDDRADAIHEAVAMLAQGDVLVIAGKGHEAGQIIGSEVLPFSDHAVARAALKVRGGRTGAEDSSRMSLLWSHGDLLSGLHAAFSGLAPDGVSGMSIDTRTLAVGDLFFALQGENRDGHAFVEAAFKAGAAAAVVTASNVAALQGFGPLYVVDDPLRAMERLGVASRARMQGRVVAVTGSVGKTSTKEALRHVLARQGETHASVASYNNHWGVPLTLARMPANTEYGVFEIGMNHPFEIIPLSDFVRPHVAIITTVEPVHLEHFRSVSSIADAKGEIFAGLLPGGVAVLNRDNPQFERLKAHAAASQAGRIVSFGEHPAADVRLSKIVLTPERSAVEAHIHGRSVAFQVGAPGRHMALNALAVLAAAEAMGADLALAALSLADLTAGSGRGQRTELTVPGGVLTLLDESYNANPASMRASMALLGQLDVGLRGRRIVILGDMLELGPTGPEMHAALADVVTSNNIDLVFACGPLMRSLWEALPTERRAAYAPISLELQPAVLAALRAGDAVMIKGSLGSRMGPIVTAMKSRYPVNQTETIRG